LVLALAQPAMAATGKKRSSAKGRPAAAKTEYRPAVGPDGVPIVRAQAVIVIDAYSGRILHAKNADAPRPPASTQKLLTALLVAEAGGLDEEVVIRASDTWAEPTKLYMKPGQRYTRRQLLEILLVRSMNDVALALARDNAGSAEGFAMKMNARARALGATSSRFVNPNGLPAEGQRSTARDMAIIAAAAYRNPTIRAIVAQKQLAFQHADGRTRHFTNTNRLLGANPYCNGMKTGYTDAAGKCLVASARGNGRAVIAVLLGDTPSAIWKDASALLTWGLSS
jgi:D-alanyl-D-alanine carboxypeptidase (penicillin-binding protein 5/6)